jgi:hypothetical protein
MEDQNPEAACSIIDRVRHEAIGPNTEALLRIFADDGIAVVAFEPDELGRSMLRTIGAEGRAVFPLSRKGKRLLRTSDDVTRRWIDRKGGGGRILLVIHGGTLLLNAGAVVSIERASGTTSVEIVPRLEPGSTDRELAQAMN